MTIANLNKKIYDIINILIVLGGIMAFKSYCWSLGTTSFRTKNFIFQIERQLQLLDEFWKKYPKYDWSNKECQVLYYEFLKSNEFVTGNSNNKDKDARQKTSGLRDFGLIDDSRKLTDVGNMILKISKSGDYSRNNIFNIPNDSYIYLLQLLKFNFSIPGFNINPFLSLVYILEKNEYLTTEEFTYLLPMCKDKDDVYYLSNLLSTINREQINYDEYILNKLLSMENYKEALEKILNNSVTTEIIEEIGMNRDGAKHDRPYYPLYKTLYELYLKTDRSFENRLEDYKKLWACVNSLSPTVRTKWKKYLFMNLRNISSLDKEFDDNFKFLDINLSNDEFGFKKVFFRRMHLFKCKSTLEDYFDLNRRYLSLTEVVRFNDYSTITLELIPKYFFENIVDKVMEEEIIINDEYRLKIASNVKINEISEHYNIDENELLKTINSRLNTNLSFDQLRNYLKDEKIKEFNQLIEKRFSNNYLIDILTKIEQREDSYLQNEITDNADIPTIFEYILGISWFKISENKGNPLEYFNLSLDNNLLPKTHAGGGVADISYHYEQEQEYNSHTLLIEATLSDSTNQRSMEMEPVSRHLGEYIKVHDNFSDYALLIAPKLDERLILDFRNMKSRKYPLDENHSIKGLEKINNGNSKYINGLKIIPLTTGIIKKFLEENVHYKEIYKIFDNAYVSNIPDEKWYNECIINKISK